MSTVELMEDRIASPDPLQRFLSPAADVVYHRSDACPLASDVSEALLSRRSLGGLRGVHLPAALCHASFSNSVGRADVPAGAAGQSERRV